MADEMAGQTETQELFKQLWRAYDEQGPSMHRESIGRCLLVLAEAFDKTLTEGMVRAYLAVMSVATPQQCVQAFATALETSRYFPTPAELRALAGLTDPREDKRRGAMQLLHLVADTVSRHGVDLKPIPGEILNDGKGPDGRVLQVPDRGPAIMPPQFTARTEAALVAVGGSIRGGLVKVEDWIEADRRDSYALAASRKFEQQWCDAYASAGGA